MERRGEVEGVKAEAAAWVVRLHADSCTEVDRAAFEAWRSASFHNEAAYERELATWERLDRLSVLGAGGAPIDPDLFAPSEPPSRRPVLKWAAGALLTLGLGGAGVVALTAPPAYATGVGERRVIVLDDGSRLELNTDSRVLVRTRGRIRQARLVRGEALFLVAADERPFVLLADHARLETRGAELTVRLAPEASVIRVSRGAATLAYDDAAPRSLAASTETIAAPGGIHTRVVTSEEVERSLAWRQGGIWLEGRSLAEAVEEFNRYNQRKLVIGDGSISNLRLGGYFRTNDVEGFVSALTKAFPIAVETVDDGYRLNSST